MGDETTNGTNGGKMHPVPVKQVVAGSWRELMLRWLFDQSVSTVLLVGILLTIGYGVPQFIVPSIQDGYRKNADSLQESLKLHLDSREREFKLIMDSHTRDRETLERAINAFEGQRK